MPWALAWGIKRWVLGVTCGPFSRSPLWVMRHRGLTCIQRERAQKEHIKEVDCVLWGICKQTSSARPRGHKMRACTWQKGCNRESKWHWFSWKSLDSWGVIGCCANPLAAAASRGWKLGSLKESKTIRGKNQNVQQMPLALLASYARSGFNS